MPIDVEAALSAAPGVRTIAWTTRDVLLYHLSLGAGRGPAADPELAWTFERDLQVLPTFALVAGKGLSAGDDAGGPSMSMPGIDIDLRHVLHAGQALRIHQPLRTSGEATLTTRISHVWDKGSAAVVVLEHSVVDEHEEPWWTTEMQIWARGEGGFGGDPGPDSTAPAPTREPDHLIDTPTLPDQARLYRLNGDLTPLHIDPEFARSAGFDHPILHGLASYGILAKALVDRLLGGDATRLRELSVRFAGPITPGQTIRAAVWRDGEDLTIVATCPERDGAPVLSRATARLAQ